MRIIRDFIKEDYATVYRCGPLIDLCRGPHVRHTGRIKAVAVTKNSASYWEGKVDAESLQRVYGISFPDAKMMKEWRRIQEEAAKRDHRKIGRDQELYFFHDLSPGSCFFLPKGAFIYNTLMALIREEYHKRGFQEVVTPNIYNVKLWETSGHWQHYCENMFIFEIEKEKFALKPMNCPGHCIMFLQRPRSWRELPWRCAGLSAAAARARARVSPAARWPRRGCCRLWRPAPERVQRRTVGSDARQALPAGRCAYILHDGPNRKRD